MNGARYAGRAALLSVVLMMLASCGWFGGDNEPALGDALIKMPEALTPAGGGTAAVQSRAADAEQAVFDHVQSLFTPVRDAYNALAYDAIEFTRQMLEQIDQGVFADETIMDYLEANGAIVFWNAEESAVTEVTRSDDGITYTVRTWVKVSEVWTKNMEIELDRAGDHLAGVVIVRGESSADESRPIYQIDFDNADPSRDGALTTEVRAVNLAYGLLEDDEPDNDMNRADKLWLLAYQNDSTFQIAANVFYLDVEVEDDPEFGQYYMPVLNNGQVDPYTHGAPGVHGCYSYIGAFLDSEDESRGKLNLALVPANYTGTESIFDEYSVAATYAEAVGNYVRDPGGEIQSPINAFLAYHRDELQTPDTPADVDTETSTEDVFTVIEFVEANLADGDDGKELLQELLFVTRLTNPAYFDASEADSFVGTQDLRSPDWADDLPEFELEVEVDQSELPELTVTMPGGEEKNTPPEATVE